MSKLTLPLFLGFTLLLYAAFPTHTYHWDGIQFSLNIESVYARKMPFHVLFHPNHLLYSAVGYLVYCAVHGLGWQVRALPVLQFLNIFSSVAACGAFFVLAKRNLPTRTIAFIASSLFAFGALWWKYSTDGDSYILTVLFLLLASLALTAAPPRLGGAILAHSGAMMFHELAVFFYVPALLLVWTEPVSTRAQRLARCAVYLLLSGVLTGLVYFACFTQVDQPYPTLVKWVSSRAEDSLFARSPFGVLVSNPLSYTKLFLGGKLGFIAQYFSWQTAIALIVLVLALASAVFFWRVRDPQPPPRPVERKYLLLLWGWLGATGLFLSISEPGNPIHKVLVWAPVVLLVMAYASRSAALSQRPYVMGAVCVALAAWNFAAFAYPHWHDSADPVLMLAKKMNRELPPGAMFYYRFFSPDDWSLAYFTPGHAWYPLPAEEPPRGRACFETTALASLNPPPPLDPAYDWKVIDSHHNVHVACLKVP